MYRNTTNLIHLVLTILVGLWNHALICYWDQPVLSNEDNESFTINTYVLWVSVLVLLVSMLRSTQEHDCFFMVYCVNI